jgi:hypothetical protein
MEKEKKASNVRNPYHKPNDEKEQTTRSYSVPAQVVAFLGYFLSLVPSKTEGSKWATSTNEKLAFYKRLFPPGTMSFTIPKANRTRPADPDYAILLEGVRVHLIRWDLNFPGLFLPCCFCNDGKLVPSTGTSSKIKINSLQSLTSVVEPSGLLLCGTNASAAKS